VLAIRVNFGSLYNKAKDRGTLTEQGSVTTALSSTVSTRGSRNAIVLDAGVVKAINVVPDFDVRIKRLNRTFQTNKKRYQHATVNFLFLIS